MRTLAKKFETTSALLDAYLAELLARPALPSDKIKAGIALISTPRSGSTLFCEQMSTTGKFGDPKEWLNTRYMHAYMRITGIKDLNFQKYLQTIIPRITSDTGIFSINFHIDQYRLLKSKKIEVFKAVPFKHSYYLERRNKLSQAYSLAKARTTDVWSSRIQKPHNYQEKIDQITHAQVCKELMWLMAEDQYAQEHFPSAVRNSITYEDTIEDLGLSAMKQIAKDLKITIDASNWPKPNLERQSNAQDEQYIANLTRKIFGKIA